MNELKQLPRGGLAVQVGRRWASQVPLSLSVTRVARGFWRASHPGFEKHITVVLFKKSTVLKYVGACGCQCRMEKRLPVSALLSAARKRNRLQVAGEAEDKAALGCSGQACGKHCGAAQSVQAEVEGAL